MARSEEFRQFLTDAVYRISACEGNKPISVVQDELGYALNKRGGGSAIEYWRQGHIPKTSDIEQLAREIVKRSDLDATWLRQFLERAHFPYPEGLQRDLFPANPMSGLPEDSTLIDTTYLAVPTVPSKLYRTLVGREALVDDIVTSLGDPNGRWLVTIDGMGGMGKTALALEVVAQCKQRQVFDAIVWVNSIKEEQNRKQQNGDEKQTRPSLSFGVVLNAVARELDAMRITHLTECEKAIWVRTLLHQQRVLVVIDNWETTAEQQEQFMDRLQSLLNPSKALLISRRRFVDSVYAIHLDGLNRHEARLFIEQESKDRRIKLIHAGKRDNIERIIQATGGSPLAMKLVVGQLSHLPSQIILKHLQEVKPIVPDVSVDEYVQLYRFIYAPSWQLLSAGGKRLLVTLALFVPGVGGTIEALKAVSALADEDIIFQHLSELWRFSLVEAVNSLDNGLERVDYYLHTLTQYFMMDVIIQSSDLLALFQENIIRAVHYLLERIQIHRSSLLPEEEQLLAMHLLSHAFQFAIAWPVTSHLLVAVAPQMEQAGHRDDWIPYLQQGVERSRALQDAKTEAELNLQLGILYQLLGQYGEANAYYAASVACFKTVNDRRGQAKAMIRQAQLYRLQRHYGEASQFVEAGFKLLTEDDVERARGYTVQGEIANDNDQWIEAVRLFEQSLKLWRRAGNQRMIAWNLTNLGVALRSLGSYQSAINHYTEAIDTLGDTNDPVHWAVTHMSLGNVFLTLHDSQEALRLYTLAEPVFQKTQEQLRLALLDNNRGIAHRELKQWEQAKAAYQSSIQRYQLIGNVELETNATDGLGLVATGQGAYEEAVDIFNHAVNLLKQFEAEPGWPYLHKEVQRHLQDARELLQKVHKGQGAN